MKKWIAMLLFCFCLVGAGQMTVYAESDVQVTKKNGQTTIYKGEIQSVVVNGQEKELGDAPGIVMENEVMLTHTAVFKKMLGMKVTYNEEEGSALLQTKEHTMKFVANSDVAIVDGVDKKLLTAPVRAKYRKTGVPTVLLPASEIARVWGYEFSHNQANHAVSFTKESVLDLTYAGLSFQYMKNPVDIELDGETLDYKMPGLLVEDHVMIPISIVAKKMGITYQYDGTKKQITLKKGSQKVVLTMNDTKAIVNGEETTLPIAPAYVKDKKTGFGCNVVPSRAIAEFLQLGYEWDKETMTVRLISSMKSDYQIAMQLPEECVDGNYSVEDDYYNYKFHIVFDGEYKDFFEENGIENRSSLVESTFVTQKSGVTTVTLQANKINGYQIFEEDGILYIKVGKPKDIYDKIVVLDAGHGGSDPGAAGNGLYEKNLTLSIANSARNYLNLEEGIKVYCTRQTNAQKGITTGSNGITSSSSLSARTNFANKIGADLFISVHINSSSSTSARGTEVYYSKNNKHKNSGGLTSQKLAQISYQNMTKAVGSQKRGVKTANFYVVNHTEMPAILIETAFISNKADANILKSKSKIDAMGEAIYNTVCEAFEQYPTN